MQKQKIYKNRLALALVGVLMLFGAMFAASLGGIQSASAAVMQSGYWESTSSGTDWWNSEMTAPLVSKYGAFLNETDTVFFDNMPYGYNAKTPFVSYEHRVQGYGISLRTKIGGVWYVQDHYDVDARISTSGYDSYNINMSQNFSMILGREHEFYVYGLLPATGQLYRSRVLKFTPTTLVNGQSELAPSATISYHNVDNVPGSWPKTYTRLDSVTLPIPPNKTDYVFDGWYANSGLTGSAVTSIAKENGGNKSFYAKWKYAYDVVPLPPDPVKTGYTFVGWYYDSAFTQPYDGAPIYSNTELFAKFNPITYSITYNTNGGSLSGQVTSYTIETNNITLSTPSKTGYSFEGWFETSNFSGTAVTSIPKGSTGNKTFYAKFTAIVYSITYNLNGGSISGQTTSYTIESGNITYPTANKTGYTFGGWYENSNLTGTAVTGITSGSTGNKVIYAKFTLIDYTITYNLNGGDMSGQATKFTIESGTLSLTTPTRTGYEFKGWYDNAELNGMSVVTIPTGSTGNKEYWAKWEILKFVVTFYVEGEVYSEMEVKYGTVFEEFFLVNKSNLAVVPVYLNAEMTMSFDSRTAITEDVSVYASSDFSIFVSLTYIVNNTEIAKDLLDYNAPLNNLRTPEPVEGYDFVGWFYDKAYTQPVLSTDKLTNNVMVYAKFAETKAETENFWNKVGAWFGSTAGITTVIIVAVAAILGGVGYVVVKKRSE